MAELRLDLCGLNENEVRELFLSSDIPMIATCRRRTQHLYAHAILAGAEYIDIDVLSPKSLFETVTPITRRKHTKRILSYHDYQKTPSIQEMLSLYRKAVELGADIVKIVTTANSIEDSETILSLYALQRAGRLDGDVPLIAYSMGVQSRYSRLEAQMMGAPIVYYALNEKSVLVPGMLTINQFEQLRCRNGFSGDVTIPTSKSVAQRAIIAAGLARGESEFHNFSHCRDIDSAVGVAKQFASKVYSEDDTLFVAGKGFPFDKKIHDSMMSPITSAIMMTDTFNIFVGESGLLSRLCIPIAAQLGEGVTITGEGNLLGRVMYGCKDTLEQFNAKCILTAEETLPAVVSGPLHGGKVTVSGKKGSQLISGLLMALPLCKKDSELTVTNVTSVPYILMTLDVIKLFGIDISFITDDNNMIFTIPGKQKYLPVEMTLEGDWSSASNFIVAAAIFGDVNLYGLYLDSHQADRDIEKIVKDAGAIVETFGNNKLHVKRGHLVSFDYEATHSPDLFPILVVLASFCEGTSTITGINRLRNKESDRTLAICQEFTKMGMELELEDDSMLVTGCSVSRRILEKRLLKGGTYSSFGDHRIAMALKIASLGCDDKVTIEGMDCINKSFPTFETLFNSLYVKGK